MDIFGKTAIFTEEEFEKLQNYYCNNNLVQNIKPKRQSKKAIIKNYKFCKTPFLLKEIC